MTFFKRDATARSPFAQTTFSANRNYGSRWDTTSQNWLSEQSGSTGHKFKGQGYVWGHFSNTSTSSDNALASMYCTSETQNRNLAGQLIGSQNSLDATSDNAVLQFGSDTEYSYGDSYYAGAFKLGVNSRLNIIRVTS